MLADLRFTTADAHFLANDWVRQHPEFGGQHQVHAFLNHPTVGEWLTQLDRLLDKISPKARGDWSKLGVTLTFAGHGNDDGSLVLADGAVTADHLVAHLRERALADKTAGLKVGLVLDSCFSGGFLLRFLEAIRHDDVLRPYYSFVSAMPDEPAWEDPQLGHGIASYCFSVTDQLSSGVVRKAIQPDNTYGPSLTIAGGAVGTALLTRGRQHPIQLDTYGTLHTTTAEIDFYDNNDNNGRTWRDLVAVRRDLLAARDHATQLISQLNTGLSARPIRSNAEVRRLATDPDYDRLWHPDDDEMTDQPEPLAEPTFLPNYATYPQPWG